MKKLIEHAFSFVIDEVSYHGDFFSVKTEETADDSHEEVAGRR